MLFYKVKSMSFGINEIIQWIFQAIPLFAELSGAESGDEGEDEGDGDDNEVIMIDPKRHYMIYLLRISAFLHSSIAFLMMISYYKLKVCIQKKSHLS